MEASMIFDFLPKNTSTGRLMVIVDEDDEDLGSPSSPSSCSDSGEEGHSGNSTASDLTDDASSSSTDSLRSHTGSTGGSPLDEMSHLMEDLPVKRGLSRHFNGKSQSFTSLANARCLQDLIKPVRRTPSSSSNKPMRSCRSYATGLDHHHHQGGGPSSPTARAWQHHQHSPKASIAKRPVRNTSFHASRPPMHPHSSGNLAGQALLFA